MLQVYWATWSYYAPDYDNWDRGQNPEYIQYKYSSFLTVASHLHAESIVRKMVEVKEGSEQQLGVHGWRDLIINAEHIGNDGSPSRID
jgi:hypothetical protein